MTGGGVSRAGEQTGRNGGADRCCFCVAPYFNHLQFLTITYSNSIYVTTSLHLGHLRSTS